MDPELDRERIVAIFTNVGFPMRVPTATWLICDGIDIVDGVARQYLSDLITAGRLELRPGGVLALVR
jgi:hypothetical protein